MFKTSLVILALSSMAVWGCAAPSGDPVSNPADDVEPSAQAEDLTKAKNDLTAAQAKLVANELNDICGDTWCEGDYSWDFSKIVCDFTKKTCTFTVLITDPGMDDGTKDDRTFWRSCKLSKISSFTAMIDTAKNGYQSLNDDFYSKVDACVGKLESNVPKAP